MRKHKNFFNIGARRFHFPKYKMLFQEGFFSGKNIFFKKNFEVWVVKYKTFYNLRARMFYPWHIRKTSEKI